MMDDIDTQNFYEEHNTIDSRDRISNFPDCILHHILSFLPSKDAVVTCILSKRWRNLWIFVPTVDFDDALLYSDEEKGWYPPEATYFMNFAESVLLLRDASVMEKFRLSCRVCFSASRSRVYAWVSDAVTHNVQELDLCLFVESPFMLPQCVFDSRSLTVVKIEMNCVLELPTFISFPCLKTLQLCLVTFPNDNSTQKLFCSCPVLQELALLDCEWMNLNSITISIPSLKKLTIDDLPYFGYSDDLRGCDIKIDAANLIHFNYVGHLLNEISLFNISSLVKAHVDIPILCERQKDVADRVVKLLGGLHRISTVVSNSKIESLFAADNVKDHLPLYQNLTHLELNMEIEKQTVGALMKLLHLSPNLQSIYFAQGLDRRMKLAENDWNFMSVPKCLLSCLRTVSFQNFHGDDTELCFLQYFLSNALVLERMNIYFSKDKTGGNMTQGEIRNQLQMLARGSKCCVLTFL